jgi:hypothetical protein
MDIGFTDHFNTRFVIFHTLQVTRAHSRSFTARSVFTRRFLVTASNDGYSSASVLKSSLNGGSLPTPSFLHRIPYRTDFVDPVVFLITPQHGQSITHRFKQYLCCCMRIHCHGNVFTEPLPRNGSTR